MRFLLFLYLISCFQINRVYGQNLYEGIIVDGDAYTPIPYANIGIVKYNRGTVSNQDGQFSITFDNDEDELEISALGYESQKIRFKDLSDTIFMESTAYMIDLVEISAQKLDKPTIQVGYKNKKRGHSIGFGSDQLGAEVGTPINIDQDFWAKSFHFVLNHAKGDSLLLRMKIYSFDDGQVGPVIIDKNILIRAKQRKGIYDVDLSPYQIILKSDVLLSLEWLKNENGHGNESITFDSKKGRSTSGIYYRYSSNSKFSLLPHKTDHHVCFYLLGKYLE